MTQDYIKSGTNVFKMRFYGKIQKSKFKLFFRVFAVKRMKFSLTRFSKIQLNNNNQSCNNNNNNNNNNSDNNNNNNYNYNIIIIIIFNKRWGSIPCLCNIQAYP